jgi:YHS domain-containing protein
MAKGMFIGNSHANGGIPSEIAETGTKIEIEGNEYYICNEAYNSPNHFDFKKKTNKEILDFIYTEFACKLNQDIMHSGDFIVCKVVVADNRKKDRKGTIKQILNEMQGEKN